ncbi:hypothetical protein B0H19DRAFT_1157354 [Mycena capillaripes]|nr:hypothetical protein B0H19DRAFT_1157354 [Mycena capillaripes]
MRRGFLNKAPKSHKAPQAQRPTTAVTAMNVDDIGALPSLPPDLAAILNISYDRLFTELPFFLKPFPRPPTASELTARLAPFFEKPVDARSLIPAAVRTASETWSAFGNGSVPPADFLRSPPGAPYCVTKIPGKGRGMLGSRDLQAGEVVLMERPLIILVKDKLNALNFFALPKAAIHALLLLHNEIPNNREFYADQETPQHRLLDYLKGVATTNAFSEAIDGDGTHAGLIVLAGSLFNHSNEYNVSRGFDISAFKERFITVAAVKKGEELTVSYGHTSQEVLKTNYGISA